MRPVEAKVLESKALGRSFGALDEISCTEARVSQKIEKTKQIDARLAKTDDLETETAWARAGRLDAITVQRPCPPRRSEKSTQQGARLVQSKNSAVEASLHSARGSSRSSSGQPDSHHRKKRAAIPAGTQHKVRLRDQGQCRYHHNGDRCQNRRYLEFHHRIPVAKGGSDKAENLVLLCSEHHRAIHSLKG